MLLLLGQRGLQPATGRFVVWLGSTLKFHDRMARLREELEANLASLRDPILTAEAFGIEEIIDPRDTRPLLIDFARRAQHIVEAETRGPKTRGMRP